MKITPAKVPSGPSGIAQQLRKSVDQNAEMQGDAMNLDDFIVPSSVASPAGLVSEAPLEEFPSIAQSNQIPIASKSKTQSQANGGLPAASVPKNLPIKARSGEFDYVQRRVRKTSIDERSVSDMLYASIESNKIDRIENDEQNSLLKFLQHIRSTTILPSKCPTTLSITCQATTFSILDRFMDLCR